ncbi:MAG: ATP-binding protein, partial [Eubacteriales bacterium]|nr:ATP-binding protein [Eubacteriales bacterium]
GRQITLAQEKENVELFVDILNIRLQQKIELKWDMEEDWMDLTFPSFFLQPLVENSIFHGLSGEKGLITIVVSVYEEEESIVIEVLDSGIGVEKEMLEKINALFSGEKAAMQDKDFHIGLSNVYNRLCLNYGKSVRMHMNSRPEKGTMVQIKIGKEAIGKYENNDN